MSDKIQITTIFRRSLESDYFYKPPKSETEYLNETFVKTGKMLSREAYVSSDKMSRTVITHFDSAESVDEFNADPIQQKIVADRNAYCAEKSIRLSLLIQRYNEAGIVSSETKVIL
jgi:hypothetical protein